MRKILFLCLLLFILISPRPTYAFRHQVLNEVLGVSTSSALPQIDPTSGGPGLILPDSPFFFLDQLKQNTRLFFAFTSEEKAKVHAQIAEERLAELRFMLAKNNEKAANVALQGVSENLKASADNLDKAQFEGKDVKKLAEEINSDIKLKQKSLDILEQNATGALKLSVQQAQDDIFKSKIKVEDSLPEDELQNEIRDDLERRAGERVSDASDSAVLLNQDLEELNKQALEASQKSLSRRQEALKSAIEGKNEKLVETETKLLEAEKVRQRGLLTAQSKAAAEAKAALEKAREAASRFQESSQKVNEIRKSLPQTSNTTNSVKSSSESSGSSSSSSGSSSSGSSSSNSGSGGSSSGSSSNSDSSSSGEKSGSGGSGGGDH